MGKTSLREIRLLPQHLDIGIVVVEDPGEFDVKKAQHTVLPFLEVVFSQCVITVLVWSY